MGNAKSRHGSCILEMPRKVKELHYAVMGNDKESVATLIYAGVDVDFPWINPRNPTIKDGSTPLICAGSLNHVHIAKLLLDAGASVNQKDRTGCTALYKAAFHGRPALIEMLLEAGADVNIANKEDRTPLFICVYNAVVHYSLDAVERLLLEGAQVDRVDNSGRAPIHIAAHWKLTDFIRLLVAVKRSTVNMIDSKGRTPLYICASTLSAGLYREDLKHQIPCIKLLFTLGADMLNLTERLRYKGPGIPMELIPEEDEFYHWYMANFTSPMSLLNLSRKCIQNRLRGNLSNAVDKLEVSKCMKEYLSRKMFSHTK